MTMWKYTLGFALGMIGLTMGIGCGGSPSQPKAADDVAGDEETGGGADCRQDGMEVEGLLGSVARVSSMRSLFQSFEKVKARGQWP